MLSEEEVFFELHKGSAEATGCPGDVSLESGRQSWEQWHKV